MQAVIKVKDLVQKTGRKTVLNGLSFEVFSGECFGLFGARGAGKTTLLHILAGVDKFKSGSVEVLGYDVKKTEAFKKHLGLVTQERSLFRDLKVCENLDFLAALKNASREDILSVADRFELRDSLNEPVGALEAGTYQRLSLACALLNSPELLIVDELIDKIDLYSRRVIVRELIKFLSGGGSCVWGFSSIEFIEQMTRVGWLENGRITVYPPQEAKEKWNGEIQFFYKQSGENHG